MPSDNKEELIEKMCAVSDNIKFHYVNSDCIQYCDDRSSPVLEVSQLTPPDADGWVEWSFHFVESGETFIFKENINEYGDKE